MATFDIEQAEGTRWAKITLLNETIVAERGALSHMLGDVQMKGRIPGPVQLLRASLSGEDAVRPRFTGTGTVYMAATLGGLHVLDLPGNETWVIESGAFWVAEAAVKQSFIRERMLTSLRSGEGFFDFQTKVTGTGKVMLQTPGPVEEMILSKDSPNRGCLVADGKQVLARTAGVRYTARFPGWMPWSHKTTGENMLRVYEGEGRLLLCTTPYWRFLAAQPQAAIPPGAAL